MTWVLVVCGVLLALLATVAFLVLLLILSPKDREEDKDA